MGFIQEMESVFRKGMRRESATLLQRKYSASRNYFNQKNQRVKGARLKDNCLWFNFHWVLDVSYTHIGNAPVLARLVEKYGVFWDGEFCYIHQKNFILRFPDWRSNYRTDYEAIKRHHGINDPKQQKLDTFLPKRKKVEL